MIHNMKCTAGLGNSDHICIYASSLVWSLWTVLLLKWFINNIWGIADYHNYKADFNKMRDMLDEIDWGIHLKDLNVFETWDSMTISLNHCIETCMCCKDQASTKEKTQIFKLERYKTHADMRK